MNITKFSDYALRVLIYLATDTAEKSSAQDIAKAYDISFHHVAKAAQWLSRENYIISERGRGGGITLAKPAAEINIGDVLSKAEASTSLVDCMKPDGGDCVIRSVCGLKHALAEAQSAFYGALWSYSLADVTQKNSALQDLLDTV